MTWWWLKPAGTQALEPIAERCADCRMSYETAWAGPAWPVWLCPRCRWFRTVSALGD